MTTQQAIFDAMKVRRENVIAWFESGGEPVGVNVSDIALITPNGDEAVALKMMSGNDVILDGQGKLAVNGNSTHRVFFVPTNVTAELRRLTVSGGATNFPEAASGTTEC